MHLCNIKGFHLQVDCVLCGYVVSGRKMRALFFARTKTIMPMKMCQIQQNELSHFHLVAVSFERYNVLSSCFHERLSEFAVGIAAGIPGHLLRTEFVGV